ncbi:MAG TPA: hypothetical protein VMW42_05355 [Desulfatiglandales bacterium]|nr:hypothetical protein [Desulfatiglandales bacterium]
MNGPAEGHCLFVIYLMGETAGPGFKIQIGIWLSFFDTEEALAVMPAKDANESRGLLRWNSHIL